MSDYYNQLRQSNGQHPAADSLADQAEASEPNEKLENGAESADEAKPKQPCMETHTEKPCNVCGETAMRREPEPDKVSEVKIDDPPRADLHLVLKGVSR